MPSSSVKGRDTGGEVALPRPQGGFLSAFTDSNDHLSCLGKGGNPDQPEGSEPSLMSTMLSG